VAGYARGNWHEPTVSTEKALLELGAEGSRSKPGSQLAGEVAAKVAATERLNVQL
jgi:hypothetical protein